jgi:hypothetical protein
MKRVFLLFTASFMAFEACLIVGSAPIYAMDYDAYEETRNITPNQIQTAIKALGPDSPFVYFDLQLSEHEIKSLKNLKINATTEYNNYGNLKGLESESNDFIKSLGEKNEETAKITSQIIVRIVNEIIQASEKETAWVALRAFTPTASWNVPRWHTDGYYYAPRTGDLYKFAISLKGSLTLFYQLPADRREEFSDLQRKGTEQNEYNRQALADLLGCSKEAISVAQPHQGAIFIVGSGNAAVHSEPPIDEQRLFLSVLPGSQTQIKEWENQ